VHVYLTRAVGILRVLAALQGTREDAWKAEEPGKILHEIRYGEMARTGAIPHTPYFGTVDATPLFVLLFAETVAWSDDRVLYADLLPNVRRALDWIERYGDLDGDGLVEYRTEAGASGHISNKVWKDSGDSLHDRAGRQVRGAIAAVEVQGYVYAACARLAEVAARMGDTAWAAELRERAERMRRTVEDLFWLEDDGFYAQALDGEKRRVDAISSNPGHLLFCGLPSPERAARVAHRLAAPDLNSGWGIRTLSAAMPTYNPMSYHNGSVWPHDNSVIVAGLRRYGHTDLALDLIEALFQASLADPLQRLPELYCGFPRSDTLGDAPVTYPVSCSPQAWAAATGHLLVRSLLGLEVDHTSRRVRIDPVLPVWLSRLTHTNLAAFGATYDLDLARHGDHITVDSDGPLERA
nr:amylo-alpha-1,6-glucosidase [Chloroflexia bacterium]